MGQEGLFLVKFKDKIYLDNLRSLDGLEIVEKFKIMPYALVKGKITESVYDQLRSHGAIEVFPNKLYKLHWIPGEKVEVNSEISATKIGAPTFWNNGYNGTGVKVAVIDTGIDSTHPDLAGKVIAKKSFTLRKYGYPKDITNPEDDLGHGTLVAGIIAGNGTDSGKGVAPGALLINGKVFQKTGPGIFDYVGTSAGIFAAVEWAVTTAGADVINLSLGGGVTREDPLVDLINYLADEYGVVFSISAGNEGQSGINTMSIGSPGVALNAITVGASSLTGISMDSIYGDIYSSIGPTPFMYVKPEISAPGTVTSTAMGGGYDTESGTSFSAPHIAGAAALLVEYLRDKGVSDSVMIDVIKPVLIKTADPIEGIGDLWCGAGYVNLTRAYEYLETAEFVDGVPKAVTVLPKRLPTGYLSDEPYFPYIEKLFIGQKVEVNISIYSSISQTFNVSIEGDIKDVLDFAPETINVHSLTDLYEFVIKVLDNATVGYYSGNIVLDNGEEVLKIPIWFYVEVPRARMIFDMKHTSWMIDFKYGQYREFFTLAESLNISVEHLYYDEAFTYDVLEQYDIIFMPDYASYYVIWNSTAYNVSIGTVTFTQEELDALFDYVNNGGVLIAIAMDPDSNNVNEANRLAELFGIRYNRLKILGNPTSPTTVKGVSGSPFAVGSLPYYGMALILDNDYAQPIMKSDAYVGVATLLTGEGGVVFSGSNFFFDNWAFNGKYANEPSDVVEFFTKILGLGIDGTWPILNVTTPVHQGELINVTVEYADGYTVSSAIIIDANGTRNITMQSKNDKYFGSIEARVIGESQIVITLDSSEGTITRISNVTVLEPTGEVPGEQPGGEEAPSGGLGNMALIIIGVAIVIIAVVGVLFYLRKRG